MLKHVVPIWDIFKADWKDYKENPRFSIFHPGTVNNDTEDIILDKETRLVWERCPIIDKKNWDAAIVCSLTTSKGNRKGWRLPTIEELLSLVDPSQNNPTLPTCHPFINVKIDDFYWSSTLGKSSLPLFAWGYNFGNGDTSNVKKETERYLWFVRGGYGYDYPF